MTLNAAERKRLAGILGMLGSNAIGERDNAARLAEHFRQQHDLTWETILDTDREPHYEQPQYEPPRPVYQADVNPIRDTIIGLGKIAAFGMNVVRTLVVLALLLWVVGLFR